MADNFHLVASVRKLSQPAFDSPILCLTEVATVDGDVAFALKHWALPELKSDEKEQLLAKYNKLISGIGVENGRKSVWWYTWTSGRCRYNSRILDDMDALARFENMLDGGMPDGLILFCPDPHLAQAVKDVAKRHGVRVHRTAADRMKWMKRRVRVKVAPFINGLKVCIRVSISRRRAGSFDVALAKARRAPQRSLIVTPIRAMNLMEPESSGDTFFGPLPLLMRNENHSVVIFGILLDRLPSFQVKGKDELEIPIIPMASFTRKRSLPFAYIKGFLSSISIKRTLGNQDPVLRPLVQRDIHTNRSSIVLGLVFENSLRRLFNILHPNHLIHACENNPWERTCSQVADSFDPPVQVTGYMHCAALLAHPKILITPEEQPVRPHPQRLVCTGDRARDIMVKYGGHPADEVIGGYALRHEYLRSMELRKALNKPVKTILVVLEGLPSMSNLLRFVFDALNHEVRYRTVIRSHPSFKLGTILDGAGLSLEDLVGLTPSKYAAISDDLAEADVVVYKGSTAAIEAGYLGIPLIHVSTANLLTDDPLFEISSLKRVVRTAEEMVPAIEEYSAMEQSQYVIERDELRRYSEQYLTIPGADAAAVFAPASG